MENRTQTCQLCHNHCSIDALGCGKGKAYFQNGNSQGQQHGHFHGFKSYDKHEQRHHSSKKHEHFENCAPLDSIGRLLMQSGHYLFRYSHENQGINETLFSCFTDAEKSELKELLTKLIVSWNESF